MVKATAKVAAVARKTMAGVKSGRTSPNSEMSKGFMVGCRLAVGSSATTCQTRRPHLFGPGGLTGFGCLLQPTEYESDSDEDGEYEYRDRGDGHSFFAQLRLGAG